MCACQWSDTDPPGPLVLYGFIFVTSTNVAVSSLTSNMAEELVSMVTVVSLLVTALYAVAGVALVFLFAKNFPTEEKVILVWLVFDVLIHLTLVRQINITHLMLNFRNRPSVHSSRSSPALGLKT